MKRAALEHILRAAAAITNERDIVVAGSQALAASILVAGRQKDLGFVGVLVSEKMVSTVTLAQRVEALALASERLDVVRNRLRRLQGGR